MAVDPGSKRVGLALSDPLGIIAQPLKTILAQPSSTLAQRLAQIAREEQAESVVVGLPKRLDGGVGDEATAARALAEKLRHLGLKVELMDERLSSRQAERELIRAGESRARRRQVTDVVAAALILQSYLESRHGR